MATRRRTEEGDPTGLRAIIQNLEGLSEDERRKVLTMVGKMVGDRRVGLWLGFAFAVVAYTFAFVLGLHGQWEATTAMAGVPGVTIVATFVVQREPRRKAEGP